MEINDKDLEKVTGGEETDQRYTVVCKDNSPMGLRIVGKSMTLEKATLMKTEREKAGASCTMTAE